MRMKSIVRSVIIMSLVSLFALLVLSVLTYVFKWKAPQAMIGITFTYILSGFAGGVGIGGNICRRLKKGNLKASETENISVGKKMVEAIFAASVFVGILILLSLLVVQNGFSLSGRFLMIWMLVTGSACLGRIL